MKVLLYYSIINNTINIPMQHKQDIKYEEEPVTYCSRCYSLNIKYEDSIGMDCCGECGCTDFKTSSFKEWEILYNKRYGHKFLETKKDIKKSPIFLLSNSQLKEKVFKSPSWRNICKTLYPSFPMELGKTDSILVLFTNLYRDNRLDDLRLILSNN